MVAETIISLLAGLTPAVTQLERLQALKRTDGSFSIVKPWAFLVGVIAIIGLVYLLCHIHNLSARKREISTADGFSEIAERYGLTVAESRLLKAIARLSGIRDIGLIFSTRQAFCSGASTLMQQRYAAGDSVADRRQIREAIEFIHRKLGFDASSEGTPGTALGPTSRQIPVSRLVSIITENSGTLHQTDATVIANDDKGLALRPDGRNQQVTNTGDKIRIRYNLGILTWEFESTVIGRTESEIIMSHSDLARFANRRRFLRVPARGMAMVAPYAFELSGAGIEDARPDFVAAHVTEIAGPGLRISTSLKTSVGDRLLVVIGFEDGVIVRHIAEVKHVQRSSDVFSIAIEFVALSDVEVSALVRQTNLAAKRLDSGQHTDTDSEHVLMERA